MAEPNKNKELREQLDIMSRLRDIQIEIGEEQSNFFGVTNAINSIEEKILRNSKKRSAAENELLNTQKQLSREGIKLLDLSKNGGYMTADFANKLAEIVLLKQKELDLTKQISDEELRKNIRTSLFNAIGLGKTLELTREIRKLWEEHPMLAVLKISSIIIKSVVTLFKELDGAAADFRKHMGFVRKDTYDLEYNVRKTYFSLAHTGILAKDLYESFQEISKTIGTSQATTIDMAKDMSLMSVSLGVAQTISAEFSRTMGMMARSTMDSQKNMALFVSRLSAAAGTNLNEVMNDVVTATKTSYQFLIKNPLALAKAAVEAKKMGTSIAEAAKAAEHLINFTESVKAEMAASVLLGESINLQRARELSYRKDLAGLNKEILELAKKARFEDLDPFQQKAVAEALGKSADELGKMLQADREMARIRADGSLAKQVKEYDELKNANESLAKKTAESSREQLRLKSNMEATKAVSVALKSIYNSMLEPLIWLGTNILPHIATGLSKINQLVNELGIVGKSVASVAAVFLLLFGAKGFGKLVSWASGGLGKSVGGLFRGISSGVKSFGNPNVIRGAIGMLLVATALIPLAFSLKLMEGVNWKTFGIMAASLTVLTGAVLALGLIMSSGVGTVAILAGAAALLIVGASLIPVAYAFKLFGEAVKILSNIDLFSVAGGLAAMVPPLFKLAMIVPFLGMMAAGMTLFGLALRVVVGPAERMGVAALELGNGLEKAVNALSRLSELKIGDTLSQFKDLSATISNISKTISEIPDIKIEKLQDIILKAGEMGSAQAQKSNEEILLALQDIKLSVELLRSSLEKGGIPAIVNLSGQRVNLAMARGLSFSGELT